MKGQNALRNLACWAVQSQGKPYAKLGARVFEHLPSFYAALFRARFPGFFRSIYLRRSMAMKQAIVGLSDLDLLFVLKNNIPMEKRLQVHAFFRTVVRATRLLDSHEEIFSESQFNYRYRDRAHFAFRVHEGRRTWTLLHGQDILPALPQPSSGFLLEGMLEEAKVYRSLAMSHEPIGQLHDTLGMLRREYFTYKHILMLFSISLFSNEGCFLAERPELAKRLVDGGSELLGFSKATQLQEFIAFGVQTRFSRSFCGKPADLESLEKLRSDYEAHVFELAAEKLTSFQ